MDDFIKTLNIYPNLSAALLNTIPSNEQQFRLKKLLKLKIIF